MNIVGLDECGRGALAGPLVACACTFLQPLDSFQHLLPHSLADSKQLTAKTRLNIFNIKDTLPIKYQILEISVQEINQKGIGWANKQIFISLSEQYPHFHVVADGNLRFPNHPITSIPKADQKYPEVMLASILGKVHRDQVMIMLDQSFPGYGFSEHKGYGTKKHLGALVSQGPSVVHRNSFITTALSRFH